MSRSEPHNYVVADNFVPQRTYQEYQFSDRTLIFAHDRVYYECRAGHRGEASPNIIWTGRPKLGLFMWKSYGLIGKYEGHVAEYSRRHLTHQADVLKALTAIMENYSEEAGTTFCFGLPLQNFSRALLWAGRHHRDAGQEPLKRRQSGSSSDYFPSWSWTGWRGGVVYDFEYLEFNDEEALLKKHPPVIDTVTKHVINFVNTWPWDTEYNVDNALNPFETGVLTIRATLATIEVGTISAGRSVDDTRVCFFDAGEPTPTHVQCLLLGLKATRTTEFGESREELVEHSHIVLAIEQDAHGIYHRSGLLCLRQAQWEASNPVAKIIRLG
jgi:hypothetical protein